LSQDSGPANPQIISIKAFESLFMSASIDSVRQRPRLLMMCYACNPYKGSEHAEAWNRAIAAARDFDVWVICDADECAESIRRYEQEQGRITGLTFVYVDPPRWQKRLARLPGTYYPVYHLWHLQAGRVAKRLHAELQFDLAHQVSLQGYREPGELWQLKIPFIWGPVGGTQNFPWRFLLAEGATAGGRAAFRSAANWLQFRTSGRVRRALRATTQLIAANSDGVRKFSRIHGVTPELMSDVATPRIAAKPRLAEPGQPLRLLWSGVFEPRKALSILLRALAKLEDSVDYRLTVLGSGKCQGKWQRLARKLGIDGRIHWTGEIPYAQAMRQYELADVFAFTSLCDTTGMVVIEAIASGLPVIAFDHQGVGDIVTEACGIKVPVTTPARAIADWEQAIRRLASDGELRERLSRGAIDRAGDYHWTKVTRRTAEIYDRALGGDRREGASNSAEKRLSSSSYA
jgi:glycosyltransferase involved in cell wall biosynthesis